MDSSYPTWPVPPRIVISKEKKYKAEIETNKGLITINLSVKTTPVTVNNFISLSLAGYYEYIPFHRVILGFMVQTGDPTGTGQGDPGYSFEDELPVGLESLKPVYSRGTVAMANAGPGTNGSQFFIVQQDQPAEFPANYSIFGHVSSGMDVVDAIASVPVRAIGEKSSPIRLVVIIAVNVYEDGRLMEPQELATPVN